MSESKELIKFHCACGQKVSATPEQFGEILPCPSCGKNLNVPTPAKKTKSIAPYLRIGMGSIFWISGLVLVSIVLLGVAKVSAFIEPWVSILFAISFWLVIPASLLFSIFKSTRIAGGYGIFWTAKLLLLCQWMLSLIYCVEVGIAWAVGGLLFWGIGIIPMSGVLMLFHREWLSLLIVLGTMAVYYLMTYSAYMLIASGEMHQARRVLDFNGAFRK